MEKYGVEQEIVIADNNEKIGKFVIGCLHPKEDIVTDGDVEFCKKCDKYLKESE